MSITLYDLSEHLVALKDSLDLCETEEQRLECEAEIQRTVDAQLHKVDRFTQFLGHLRSQIDLAKKEIERLKLREAVFTNLEERLEKYATFTMQRLNLTKLEGETSKLVLRTNTPGVEIDNAEAVPPQFKTIRQEVVIDKRGIKKAIDGGENVPGAHLRAPTVSLLRK